MDELVIGGLIIGYWWCGYWLLVAWLLVIGGLVILMIYHPCWWLGGSVYFGLVLILPAV